MLRPPNLQLIIFVLTETVSQQQRHSEAECSGFVGLIRRRRLRESVSSIRQMTICVNKRDSQISLTPRNNCNCISDPSTVHYKTRAGLRSFHSRLSNDCVIDLLAPPPAASTFTPTDRSPGALTITLRAISAGHSFSTKIGRITERFVGINGKI